MTPQAAVLWRTLELRTPAMLDAVDRLGESQLTWAPPNGGNSVAWLLWHIAEVEDNWVRDKLHGLERRYPFGTSVKAGHVAYPSKAELLAYFRDVRDHLMLVNEEVSAQRDLLTTVLEANMAVISVEQNEISVRQNATMQQLTVIATVSVSLAAPSSPLPFSTVTVTSEGRGVDVSTFPPAAA